jgi:hypothetical protein
MPPNYSTPEGKPFNNVYFVKAPEKSDAKLPASSDATVAQTMSSSVTREKCVIMQAAQKPPYFYLQMQEDKLDVSPGENILHSPLTFCFSTDLRVFIPFSLYPKTLTDNILR